MNINEFEGKRGHLPTVETGIIKGISARLAQAVSMTVGSRLSQSPIENSDTPPASLKWNDGKSSFWAEVEQRGPFTACTFFEVETEANKIGIWFGKRQEVKGIGLEGRDLITSLKKDFPFLSIPQSTECCNVIFDSLNTGGGIVEVETSGAEFLQRHLYPAHLEFAGLIGAIETNLFPPTSST